MKLIKYLIFTLFIVISFGGCGKQLNVVHNEKKNETHIQLVGKVYILQNSKHIRNTTVNDNPLFNQKGSKTNSYSSSDDICKLIRFRTLPHLGQRQYYLSTAKEDVYKQYRNNCTTEKINNLEFHDCNFRGVITQTNMGSSGPSEKKYLEVDNMVCFNKLKSIGKNISEDDIQTNVGVEYSGKFRADKTSNSQKCPSVGSIKANINEDTINGLVKFSIGSKEFKRNLTGKVKENEFYGETPRIKFYGNITDEKLISGEYFNRQCKGTFTLKKKGKIIWQTGFYSKKLTWDNAKKYCKNLKFDGHSDWRLPSIDEFKSINYDFVKRNFGKVPIYSNYWTNTEYKKDNTYAWLITLPYLSDTDFYAKEYDSYVQCVREE